MTSAKADIAGLIANTPPSMSARLSTAEASKYVGAAEVARATTDSAKSSASFCRALLDLKK